MPERARLCLVASSPMALRGCYYALRLDEHLGFRSPAGAGLVPRRAFSSLEASFSPARAPPAFPSKLVGEERGLGRRGNRIGIDMLWRRGGPGARPRTHDRQRALRRLNPLDVNGRMLIARLILIAGLGLGQGGPGDRSQHGNSGLHHGTLARDFRHVRHTRLRRASRLRESAGSRRQPA